MAWHQLPIPGIARGAKLAYETEGGTLYVRCGATGWAFVTTETNDFHAACKVAKDVMALHVNPSDTTERSQRAREIWAKFAGGGSTRDTLHKANAEAAQAAEALANASRRKLTRDEFIISVTPAGNTKAERAALDEATKKAEALYQTAIAERDAFKLEVERLKIRNRELEGLLKKVNNRITHEQQPVTMADAVTAFLDSGHGSDSHWQKDLKSYCNRFRDSVGKDKNIFDVMPSDVIDWLEDVGGEWEGKTTKNAAGAINQFMANQTRGQWNDFELMEWLRRNVKGSAKDYFWLEDAEADVLIETLGNFGEYWSDVATIQRACGFRPEELPLIQVKNVDLEGRSIFIEHILDNTGKEIRTLKTARSTDKVNVPAFAMPALKRRVKAAGESIILLPRNAESGTGAHWPGYSDFEWKNQMWPDPDTNSGKPFSHAYRTRLQDAAEAMGLPTAERVVARTFRSTCGKELLLSGKSTEQVAAVLRDNPETVRKHYARLLAQDVSTERGR